MHFQFSYNIPSSVVAPHRNSDPAQITLSPVGAQTFPVRVPLKDANHKAYYEGLLHAVRQAKDVTGKDLTVWKDAVGDAEKNKEAAMPKPAADHEDEDEVDEEAS